MQTKKLKKTTLFKTHFLQQTLQLNSKISVFFLHVVILVTLRKKSSEKLFFKIDKVFLVD